MSPSKATSDPVYHIFVLHERFTSTVSNTLIMPGCLRVLSLRTAFLAKGNRDLLAAMSKLKILQFEVSS